jgi:hypothetical protein
MVNPYFTFVPYLFPILTIPKNGLGVLQLVARGVGK